MIRRALAVAGLLLLLFHGWLFAGHVWDGQLDLAQTARWLVAAGLVVALHQLRRRGIPLFHGRRAVAIWLLAALLHGPAVSERTGVSMPALPDIVAVLAPVSIGVMLAGFGVWLALALGRRRRTLRLFIGIGIDADVVDPFALDSYPILAARPPPNA